VTVELWLREREGSSFSGRLILGNSPAGRTGWWGEVHGLAIYGRALTPEDISRHARVLGLDRIRALAGEATVLALYPFDEGRSGTARNLADEMTHIWWPRRFSSLAGSMLRFPGDDARERFIDLKDMLQNILLFLPFGYVVCMIGTRRGDAIRPRRLLAAVLFAGCFSTGIEIAQIYLPSRAASTMDVAWNTAGALLGALLCLGVKGRRAGWVQRWRCRWRHCYGFLRCEGAAGSGFHRPGFRFRGVFARSWVLLASGGRVRTSDDNPVQRTRA
jgi:VanZ family protein